MEGWSVTAERCLKPLHDKRRVTPPRMLPNVGETIEIFLLLEKLFYTERSAWYGGNEESLNERKLSLELVYYKHIAVLSEALLEKDHAFTSSSFPPPETI